jgi:hypothetical protein
MPSLTVIKLMRTGVIGTPAISVFGTRELPGRTAMRSYVLCGLVGILGLALWASSTEANVTGGPPDLRIVSMSRSGTNVKIVVENSGKVPTKRPCLLWVWCVEVGNRQIKNAKSDSDKFSLVIGTKLSVPTLKPGEQRSYTVSFRAIGVDKLDHSRFALVPLRVAHIQAFVDFEHIIFEEPGARRHNNFASLTVPVH